MVNIKLSQNYSIGSDRLNWMLMKGTVAIGFYDNLSNLIKDYIAQRSRLSNAESIQELINFQKRLVNRINGALQPLNFRVI